MEGAGPDPADERPDAAHREADHRQASGQPPIAEVQPPDRHPEEEEPGPHDRGVDAVHGQRPEQGHGIGERIEPLVGAVAERDGPAAHEDGDEQRPEHEAGRGEGEQGADTEPEREQPEEEVDGEVLQDGAVHLRLEPARR